MPFNINSKPPSVKNNPIIKSVFVQEFYETKSSPARTDNFRLLNGDEFRLLNGSLFKLLKDG